jgi:transposase
MKARSESLGAVEGLRKWSPAEQAQLLEEALQPGVTLASVADKHGISRGLFYRFVAKARSGLLPGVTVKGLPTPRFVPVRLMQTDGPVAAPVPAPTKAGSPVTTGSSVIEIVLGNGRILKARENIDPAILARLAEALDKPAP